MNGVKFIRENGGLGRRQEGTDFISGIIVYGETATDKRLILSVSELDKAGQLLRILCSITMFRSSSE